MSERDSSWREAALYAPPLRPLPTYGAPWEYGDGVAVTGVGREDVVIYVNCRLDVLEMPTCPASSEEGHVTLRLVRDAPATLEVEGLSTRLVVGLIELGPEQGRRALSLLTGRAMDAAFTLLSRVRDADGG